MCLIQQGRKKEFSRREADVYKRQALDHADGNSAMDEINETGALKLDVSGQEITLFKEDLLIDTEMCIRDRYWIVD